MTRKHRLDRKEERKMSAARRRYNETQGYALDDRYEGRENKKFLESQRKQEFDTLRKRYNGKKDK